MINCKVLRLHDYTKKGADRLVKIKMHKAIAGLESPLCLVEVAVVVVMCTYFAHCLTGGLSLLSVRGEGLRINSFSIIGFSITLWTTALWSWESNA